MKKFCDKYNVSRETYLKLKKYQSMLVDWQQKFNLVSNSSLDCAWERHFLDSMQLIKYIPSGAKVLYDLGSGAGFPGMVIAIVFNEKNPELRVNLIESIYKKTVYLNAVKKENNIAVDIINDRIENIKQTTADVITSRALASLSNLLKYAYRFSNKKTICIFPKGKKYKEELAEAHKHWKFKCEIFASEQSDEGKVLIISNLRKNKGENKCQES